jgi:hypothetical protein
VLISIEKTITKERRFFMSTQSTKQNISIAGLILLIIIVGVLVALSVPRFIEASNRAKAAEPPRVISSYESSQLADYVRDGRVEVTRVGELGADTVAGGGK